MVQQQTNSHNGKYKRGIGSNSEEQLPKAGYAIQPGKIHLVQRLAFLLGADHPGNWAIPALEGQETHI